MKSFIVYSAIAFLCGATPTAYWTAMRLRGIDIRKHGSGNAGATNVTRVLGKGPGYFVFVIDFLKGLIPVLVYRFSSNLPAEPALLGVGFFSVMGHVFSPWLSFKGGKGIATGAGMLTAAVPFNFAVSFILWLVFYFTTRTVSISSLAAVLALPISGLFFKQDIKVVLWLACLFFFILWTHRSNIARLISGTENKFKP